MEQLQKSLARKYPCRNEIVKRLYELIGDSNEAFPASIYLYGHSGTGKTAVLKEFLRLSAKTNQLRSAIVNCVECYTTKVLLENILEQLINEDESTGVRCDNLKDFVGQLQQLKSSESGYIFVLDNAERLRDMEANVLPTFLRLQQMCGINVCVVLISQLPFEKYYCKTGLSEVITLYSPQYSKAEILEILGADFSNTQALMCARLTQNNAAPEKLQIVNCITTEFFGNFLNVFLSVFYKACRDVPELKIVARKCFAVYMEPVLNESVNVADVSRLWRNIAGPLKAALSQVYMRFDQANNVVAAQKEEHSLLDQSVRKLALSLELPYYGKYLLIAAYLASYNSAKNDKRLFVKHHGKQRKRMQSVNAKAKVTEKMSTSLGPKSFSIDRLLAIFYAILDEKVGLTCNLLSQISTLVHLKLLTYVSGESNVMDGSARLQCTVSLDFVLYIGKVVDFNVRQYLCDFM